MQQGSGWVVWQFGVWRCEHRIDSTGDHWVELYNAGVIAVSRPLRETEQLREVAEFWRLTVSDAEETPRVMSEPTRRRFGERRLTARGGRRYDDSEFEPPSGVGPH